MLVFSVVFRRVLEGSFCPLGTLLDHFRALFGTIVVSFWGWMGFVEIDAPLKRNHTF